jgi:transposase InsO family protein
MLRVKELRLGTAHKEASSSALVASTASSCTSSSCRSTPSSSSSGGSGKGKGKGKGGRGGNGGGGGGSNGGRRNQQQGGGRQGPSQAGPWVCYNPWAQPQQQQWAPQPQQQQWVPQPQQQQAHTAFAPAQYSAAGAPSGSWGTTPPGGWNSAGLIAALNQLAVREPSPWVMDSGATSHMTSNDGILLSRLSSPPSSITVGNGHSIPIISRGTSTLHLADRPLQLHNVLVAPQLTHNLLSVRQLTRDNNCSIEFDASGFSVKDLLTQTVLLRCNSNGDLYTIPHRTPPRCHVAVVSPELWHSRLGHPAPAVVQTLNKISAIQCNKAARRLCHVCQLGKHAKLPFTSSVSSTSAPFELVHCDVWTSPVLSISGYKYYLVLVDDFTHYCWIFPLRHKSEVHQHIVQFIPYAHTQFSCLVRCFQADNGTEFLNHVTATFLAGHGILLRTSCPYTSAQNGKAERMLRTLNNVVRTLLIHAAMPPSYWVEALSTAVFLLN